MEAPNRVTFFRIFSVLFLLFFSGATEAQTPQSLKINTPAVRVLVTQNQKSIYLSIKAGYKISALPALQSMKTSEGLINAQVLATPKGIKIGKEEWAINAFRIEPEKSNDLVLGKSRFRGVLDIRKDSSGAFTVINRLSLEDYLYGVLHHEVASWWPMDALKAQAVAARTYALYQVSVSKTQEFDLKNTTSSQVYGGSARERYRTKKAINVTKGEALTYQGKIFPAYFHATCGGKTAAASELWKIDLPPLAGGTACGYCRVSPHYYWHAKVPVSVIEEKLSKYGQPLGQILKIEVISQTPSGRVGSIRITGTAQEFVMAAKDFRVWVGGERIRSTNFTVSVEEDVVYFKGKGWGHGVGLCQWGALGQALLGKGYKEILNFYYPNSQITAYEYP